MFSALLLIVFCVFETTFASPIIPFPISKESSAMISYPYLMLSVRSLCDKVKNDMNGCISEGCVWSMKQEQCQVHGYETKAKGQYSIDQKCQLISVDDCSKTETCEVKAGKCPANHWLTMLIQAISFLKSWPIEIYWI